MLYFTPFFLSSNKKVLVDLTSFDNFVVALPYLTTKLKYKVLQHRPFLSRLLSNMVSWPLNIINLMIFISSFIVFSCFKLRICNVVSLTDHPFYL